MIDEQHRSSGLWKETYWLEGDWLGEQALCYLYQSQHETGAPKREVYMRNGLLHNDQGPAHISWQADGQINREEYYLDDKPMTKEQWQAKFNQSTTGDWT